MGNELAQLDALQTALAEAEDIKDVALIRAKMEVLAKTLAPRYIVPRFKAAEGLVRASAKHGEFWNGLDNKHPAHVTKVTSGDTFTDFVKAGFKHRMDATRCAAIAEMDPQDLDYYFEMCREENRFPSLGGAYKIWKEMQPEPDPEPPQDVGEGLVVGDFRDVSIPDGSIDLIFTDPPYGPAAVGLYEDLAECASEWLAPSGICAVYSGQMALPEVMAVMSSSLSYFWTCAILHTGDKAFIKTRYIRNAWKPVLLFFKPPLNIWWGSLEDAMQGRQEKSHHPWQQGLAEAEHFIEKLSGSGQMVLDPMCGSGTTLVAAQNLGRKHLGIDVDESAIQLAKERLNDKG